MNTTHGTGEKEEKEESLNHITIWDRKDLCNYLVQPLSGLLNPVMPGATLDTLEPHLFLL